MSDLVAIRDDLADSGVSPVSGPASLVRVEVKALRPGIQLRMGKVNHDHLSSLVQVAGNWPPIVVSQSDHTIVDGHYRYLAACQLGHTHIDCVYFRGGRESAFLEALQRNRDHGLPLSLGDREQAAHEVLEFHPDWSDRRIGVACGLAPGTVGRIRGAIDCPSDQGDQLKYRLGRDGRNRPVDPRTSRDRVATELRAQPDRSLREIARITGTSPATVRSVRAEQRSQGPNEQVSESATTPEALPALRWISDAAVGSAAGGELFAPWFERTNISGEWQEFVEGIPISRIYEIADEARRRAAGWMEFAAMVEGRVRTRRSMSACS